MQQLHSKVTAKREAMRTYTKKPVATTFASRPQDPFRMTKV